MTGCDICKKSFSSRDIYIGGKLIARHEEFCSPSCAADTKDLCEECLYKVLNFIGKLKKNNS